MFNNVLDRKETFFGHKNFSLPRTQNRIFSKGLTHASGKKLIFFLFVCPQSKTRNNVQQCSR